MKPRRAYTVVYERDESGFWVASVAGILGCHTQGRTIEQARERAREAIQAALDLPGPYAGRLTDDVRLPPPVKKAVTFALDARAKAAVADNAASEQSRRAIAALTGIGLSLRDAGELLGVSRQRAQKLAS
jgi:predicted RNase H-like HicB family nuclease